jgi:O-antigen/teichoic acid export membrane protein
MNPNGSVLLAKGRADLAFYWDSGIMLLYGLSLYAAVLTKDLTITAWTYAAISLINFFIGRWLLKYVIQLEDGRIFQNRWKTAGLDTAHGIAGSCLERRQQTSASRRHASAGSFRRNQRNFLRFSGQ